MSFGAQPFRGIIIVVSGVPILPSSPNDPSLNLGRPHKNASDVAISHAISAQPACADPFQKLFPLTSHYDPTSIVSTSFCL